jgi:RHS repeat-associated protein
VNGLPAQTYADFTFASLYGYNLTDGQNSFTNVATNYYGTASITNIVTANLPASLTLQYDANGNLTNDGSRSLSYDAENQLTNVNVAGQWRSDFFYDGLGRRRIERDYAWQSAAWALTNEVRYVYDGMVVLQELDSNNVAQVAYTRGLDFSGSIQGGGGIGGLLARTDANGSIFYHADGSGNVTALMDSGGNIAARYLYDPFGRLLGKWGALADANAIQFSSMPRNANSSLSLYAFRAYDPNLQRWLNRDPIGELGGLNLYNFVRNNPPNLVDRDGRNPLLLVALVILLASAESANPPPPPPVIYDNPLAMIPPGTPILRASENGAVTGDFLNGTGGSQFVGTGMEQPMAAWQALTINAGLQFAGIKCPGNAGSSATEVATRAAEKGAIEYANWGGEFIDDMPFSVTAETTPADSTTVTVLGSEKVKKGRKSEKGSVLSIVNSSLNKSMCTLMLLGWLENSESSIPGPFIISSLKTKTGRFSVSLTSGADRNFQHLKTKTGRFSVSLTSGADRNFQHLHLLASLLRPSASNPQDSALTPLCPSSLGAAPGLLALHPALSPFQSAFISED